MTFIAGFALGVLATITLSLLSIASDADNYDE
jgi:hypothetical protein